MAAACRQVAGMIQMVVSVAPISGAMDLSAFRAKKKDQLLGETQKPNMQNPLFLRKRSPCCQVPHVEGKAQNVERSRQLYLADHFGQRLLCKYRYIDVYMYVCILYM